MWKIRKFKIFLPLVLLLVALTLFARAMPTALVVSADSAREDQIREASAAWDEAFNAADVDALMELYADDAVSMPPGFETLGGKEAIRADFEWFFDNFESHHETTVIAILMSGNLAIEHGVYHQTFTPKDGSEPFEENGRHIEVRKKSGNSWKIVKEIWNLTP